MFLKDNKTSVHLFLVFIADFEHVQHHNQVFLLLSLNRQLATQQTFSCSKSTIETLEKDVKYIQVNNKDTRTTPLTFF